MCLLSSSPVAFKLYDRDGNGVLDSSVSSSALFDSGKLSLIPPAELAVKRILMAQLFVFFPFVICAWTGSGSDHCADDARRRLSWLGRVGAETGKSSDAHCSPRRRRGVCARPHCEPQTAGGCLPSLSDSELHQLLVTHWQGC